MTMDSAVEIAATHPKVFLKMFENGQSRSSVIPNTSSVRTDAVASTAAQAPRVPLMKMTTKQRAAYIKQRMTEEY